jgi:hypothetical protein
VILFYPYSHDLPEVKLNKIPRRRAIDCEIYLERRPMSTILYMRNECPGMNAVTAIMILTQNSSQNTIRSISHIIGVRPRCHTLQPPSHSGDSSPVSYSFRFQDMPNSASPTQIFVDRFLAQLFRFSHGRHTQSHHIPSVDIRDVCPLLLVTPLASTRVGRASAS